MGRHLRLDGLPLLARSLRGRTGGIGGGMG
jgi:hypothetical protein